MAFSSSATRFAIPTARRVKSGVFGPSRPTSCRAAASRGLEDLNQQPREWATVRMEQRPASKTGLNPRAKVFEHERSYLTALPAQLPVPYWPQERGTDAYGYVSFEGNYYWVPGSKREDVKVLRYKVIVVQSRDLNDPQAVRLHLRNIAQAMGRGDLIT